ncbi:MAG: threonine synthase [Gammaproteobacteria bacterium]|nr:MAG: threonine synthase [Gammaproteobacteria bacterium]
MRYVSTRGQTPPESFQDAVLTGLAPDGGLLVPETIPDVRDRLDDWRELSFQDLALEIVSLFCDDIPRSDLATLIDRAYRSFDHPEVTPSVQVGDQRILELWHGPTLAFKDIALQLLGHLFEYILEARGQSLNILGATSGDTGSAAIAGVRGRHNIHIFIMFPRGRTSRVQELQMTTVADANVHALSIDGSFDDCQALLKATFGDLEIKRGMRLGAVNSVNWARVMAQIVYYFYAGLRQREPVGFAVPTGNFGDIFAGWLAARMGLPVERLILATNENDILSVFFNSGVYRRGQVRHTISPSMDIQVASNFERFLYYLCNEDAARLRQLMADFAERGELCFEAGCTGRIDPLFQAIAVDAQTTLATIRDTWRSHRYLLDPHTAVGVAAANALAPGQLVICLATAHPAKFPESVQKAVGEDLAHHPAVDALVGKPVRSVELPADVDAVKAFVREHGIR